MTTENQSLDMSVLDMDMSDIEDLPGFEVPANGEYILNLKTSVKEVNDIQCVEMSYEVVECVKKDNDADDDAKPGSKFSQLFQLTNPDAEKRKISLGKLKETLAGISESTGQTNVGVIVRDVIANAVVMATIKRRADREDKEKFYATVKNLRLA